MNLAAERPSVSPPPDSSPHFHHNLPFGDAARTPFADTEHGYGVFHGHPQAAADAPEGPADLPHDVFRGHRTVSRGPDLNGSPTVFPGGESPSPAPATVTSGAEAYEPFGDQFDLKDLIT